MHQTRKDMDEAGIETLGHLTQIDVGKLYQRGAIFAYPTEFPEIDCISARKAQACGCVPVTTDFGALADSVQFGVKVPSPKRNIWEQSNRFHFGVENLESQRLWVDAVVDLLTNPTKRAEFSAKGVAWAHQFAWPEIAARWNAILRT
jgi:glycosyltransferase involved in cell wall biosynthesis